MKDWREARNRHWKGKGRRVVLAGAILVVAMLWLGACMMRPGSKLWHMVSAQEAYQTCELKAGQYCSEAMEPRCNFSRGRECGKNRGSRKRRED